ncbi:MAG: cupin domain-containing protein [Gemmataceae bacterium]
MALTAAAWAECVSVPDGASCQDEAEGGPDNAHRGADQWLFVVSGSGEAVVNKRKYALSEGTLLLIERGDTHEVRNTGTTPVETLNVYVPPAYTLDGGELPPGKK